jgi:arylsulfatase A-like enzyme
MITRKAFNGMALTSLSIGAFGCATPPKHRRPNVLFVMADEWRGQSIGYEGDLDAHTPSFDRFAGESVNFDQAISGCSVCCPARASLVTGQYPLTNGVYINDAPLRPNAPTLGEVFRAAGYRTAYIGKWHLYGSPGGRWERREAYIPPEYRFGFDYWKVAECTHDYNHSLYYDNDDTERRYWEGYDAFAQTDDARRFIQENAGQSEPYFLMLSWGPPHFPLHTAPERYRAMYRDRRILLRPNVPDEAADAATAALRGYYAHMAALDDCFARILNAVEAAGQVEDTVVVFTSDHGDMMESQGLGMKMVPWEESIRVPFLLRYPRMFGTAGTRNGAPLNSPDIMPTLLGVCGVPIPEGVQGTDFATPLRRGNIQSLPESAFLNVIAPGNARQYGFAEYRGVRTRSHTYVRSINGPWLLYDNINDPYQKQNLCGRADVAALEEQLERELSGWLNRLDDDFLHADEYLRRDGLSHYVEMETPISYERSPWGDWESTMPKPHGPLDVRSPLTALLADPEAAAIVEAVLPGLRENPTVAFAGRGFSLRMLHQYSAILWGFPRVSEAQLAELERRLAQHPSQTNRSDD